MLLGAIAWSVACRLVSRSPKIDPPVWHISLKGKFPSSTDSRRASCKLLAKEWAGYWLTASGRLAQEQFVYLVK